MKQWSLIIDVEKCEDCNNCFLSCKDEHVDNEFPRYSVAQPKHGHRWINIMRKERGQYPLIDVAYLLIPCMHCDNAPCIKKAQNGAVYKRQDGIVIIDPEKATGQKGIVDACPYDAIWWNEEKNLPQKCTLCVHLLDEVWMRNGRNQGAFRLVRPGHCAWSVLMILRCRTSPNLKNWKSYTRSTKQSPVYITRICIGLPDVSSGGVLLFKWTAPLIVPKAPR